jgi:poly-gamma-glutamate synthesis protein (capsule biosynthesis protein)
MAASAPLRLTLLGQSLIQHDLRGQVWAGRAALTDLLKGGDVVFSDLETALRSPGAGPPTREPLLLHAAPVEALDSLMALGVTLLATANNHAWDLGTAGVAAALAPLDARGLTHAGTGVDLAAAAAPAVQVTPHGRVALVAAATGAIRPGAAATAERPGVNELRRGSDGALNAEDLGRVLDAVVRAGKSAEVVMLYHHNHDWEPDNAVTPGWQKELAHRAVAAGASLFASHGAPRLHGIEVYRGAPIFYDLGNFIFQTRTRDDRYGPEAWEGVVVACDFREGRFRQAALTPLVLNGEATDNPDDLATRGRPAIADPSRGRAILRRLETLSRPYGTHLRPAGDRLVLLP